MADKIYLNDLVLDCVIGLLPRERMMRQRVVLNIEMTLDLRAAGASDNLADTVDYKALKDNVVEELSASNYFLIEALAEHVSRLCRACPGVEAVRVRVDKPGALTGTRSVAVEIER